MQASGSYLSSFCPGKFDFLSMLHHVVSFYYNFLLSFVFDYFKRNVFDLLFLRIVTESINLLSPLVDCRDHKPFVSDFLFWLQTQPHKRLFNKFPIQRTVVSISLKFGSGVAAFFAYYSWIIWLNLALSLLWGCLVVAPRAFDMDHITHFGDFIRAVSGVRDPKEHSSAIW
jgi:hypothetical protein